MDTKNIRIANVRDFGAIGDGKADDTEAIEKAWAFVMDTRKPQFNSKGTISVNPILYFPQGIYRYTGKGLQSTDKGSQTWEIKGDGINSARIDIESDVYLITCERVQSTVIRDLSFNGGKGVFRSVYTKNMVGGKHMFYNCYFFNYSECAIGNNANDSPYLTIYDCVFHCKDKAEAIGVAWGGYVDDSQIARCAFEQNAYHIKVGDRQSGSFQIGPRNLFLSWGNTKTKADVWLVPNTESGIGINSGQGAVIAENKFGNENIDRNAPRILIASEDLSSGPDRLSRKPSTKIGDEKSSITGWRLRDNLINGSQGMKRGFVFSRIPNTALIFDHNYFTGGPHPYLIEFDSQIKRLPDRTPANGTYVYSQERDNIERDLFPTELCNLPGYAVALDPYSNLAGAAETPSAWPQSNDPGFTPLVSMMGCKLPALGHATLTPARDPLGGMTAASVHIADGVSGVDVRLDQHNRIQEGRVIFIDVEVKASETSSLDRVSFLILNRKETREAIGPVFIGDKVLARQRVFSRTVKLQPYWQRLTIPFVVRDARDGEFHLAIRPYGYDSQEYVKGQKDRFECGNVRVYHAKSPDGGERKGFRIIEDRDAALCAGIDPEQIIYQGQLSADRKISLISSDGSLSPLPGTKLRIARAAAGNFVLRIDSLSTLSAGEWCELIYTGTQYVVVAKGKL